MAKSRKNIRSKKVGSKSGHRGSGIWVVVACILVSAVLGFVSLVDTVSSSEAKAAPNLVSTVAKIAPTTTLPSTNSSNKLEADVTDTDSLVGSMALGGMQFLVKDNNKLSTNISSPPVGNLGRALLVSPANTELTINRPLQERLVNTMEQYRFPWAAVVVIRPQTGEILAMSSYSSMEPELGEISLRALFPAASLFKVISAAAAVELAGKNGFDMIQFRGGDHTLNQYNYAPDQRLDRRNATLAHGLAHSVNPIFARVGLQDIGAEGVEAYARSFQFGRRLESDLPIDVSNFHMGADDYDVAMTSAGFGRVEVSPLHAALISASLGNNGVMMKPHIVRRVTDDAGEVIYEAEPKVIATTVLPSTAREVNRMMEQTTIDGTAARHFRTLVRDKGISISGKTGTLQGDYTRGTHFWFIGNVPAEKPEISIAVLVVDNGRARTRAVPLARKVIDDYLALKE